MSLWERGNFYAIFGLIYSSGVFGTVQIAEMWLGHLPPQVGARIAHPRNRSKRHKTGYMLQTRKTCAKLSFVGASRVTQNSDHVTLLLPDCSAGETR